MLITSVQNPRVKQAARLRNSRERAGQGRIIIDGVREIGRALDAGVAVRETYVCEPLCDSTDCRALLKRLERTQAERFEVSPMVFEKLAYGERAEGIVAIADRPRTTLDDIKLPAHPLVAVLEGIEKPGNIGAILRTADGAGVAPVIAVGCVDLYNPNMIRASLGAIFTFPVCAASHDKTIQWLRRNELSVYAARVDGAVDYTSVDLAKPCAIVLGSEADGLSDDWRGPNVTAIRLPMHGAADSLNVSAAAAVLFYEARRQRTLAGK